MRPILVSAAWFNWLVALSMVTASETVFTLFHVSPHPDNPFFIHLFSLVIAVFGLGYYWAASDLVKHRSIVQLGTIGKFMLVLVCLLDIIFGIISWQIMLLAGVDLVYALIFIYLLKSSGKLST